MNKYPKIALLLFAILIIAAAITYLSIDDFNLIKMNKDTPEPETTEEALTDLGKFVIVVPLSDAGSYTFGNEIAKQSIIDAIAEEKKVKIDFEVIEISNDNFTDELNQLLSTSTYIDAITADSDLLASFAQTEGLIAPIDSVLETDGANIYNTIDETYWETTKIDSMIYGIPSMNYPEQSVMMARSDQLYMFSTEPITSFTSLISLCNFYKTAGYEYPMAVTWDQLIDIFAYTFYTTPYEYTVRNGEFTMREHSISFTHYFLEEIKVLYEQGFLHPNLFTATPEDMKNEIISGRSAIYVAEYNNLIDDRATLKTTLPDAELKLITPLTSKYIDRYDLAPKLSGEKKADNILMFTESGQSNQALITYLDWMYSSQANYFAAKYGAPDTQTIYYPETNQYEYIGDYNMLNKPYDGLYTLGLSANMLYAPPSYIELTTDIMSCNTLLSDVHSHLSQSDYTYPLNIQLSKNGQAALAEYLRIMTDASAKYFEGEISINEYEQYKNECDSLGITAILYEEVMNAYNQNIPNDIEETDE